MHRIVDRFAPACLPPCPLRSRQPPAHGMSDKQTKESKNTHAGRLCFLCAPPPRGGVRHNISLVNECSYSVRGVRGGGSRVCFGGGLTAPFVSSGRRRAWAAAEPRHPLLPPRELWLLLQHQHRWSAARSQSISNPLLFAKMPKKAPGPNKKKQTLKFTIDCTTPVDDHVLDPASFEKFL